ncbi:MAG: hypothetical protein AAGA03_09690 [Planctomycetota bacterium]
MAASTTAPLELKRPADLEDPNGYATLWSIAAATFDDDLEKTREFAGRLLGFLCKQKCDFVVCSSTDAEYLDSTFERDNKLLYNWKAESEYVDMISQHAEVPYNTLRLFLLNRKFKPDGNYSPRRADRVEWFQDMWNVG